MVIAAPPSDPSGDAKRDGGHAGRSRYERTDRTDNEAMIEFAARWQGGIEHPLGEMQGERADLRRTTPGRPGQVA